ncbi:MULTISPECIES: ROK family protein [unclassified Microbacterium]|uniref:ROK family protein n=1 Tax=unclassified Microbacterium TaxID=2609290 RepID=UPI0012F72423|nr:ROK family protein [Microbacterium sp. MAH-37]MVQ41302.1 ROK family protein [Microbacterium sp. MAH-37]
MLYAEDELDGQALVRRSNLRRALQLVFDNSGSETRAGIARATGLTAATASSLVAELIEQRLIAEVGQAASTGGKRATVLAIDATLHLFLVVVLRYADAHAALIALDGASVYEERIVYSSDDRDQMIRAMLGRIAQRFGPRLLAAAVQLPGATDGRVVLESVQLEWIDLPLADELSALLGAPVQLVNDVDAEAVAETIASGSSSGRRLFLHMGIGVGATVTLDGEPEAGPHARMGEIGHVQVVFGDDARACPCGRRGCLESAASMPAMLGPEFDEGMDDAQVRALIEAADPALLAGGAVALGRVITMLTAMLDPAEVVIGGSAAGLGEEFLDLVRAETEQPPSGTVRVPVRGATGGIVPFAGAAQFALGTALGVRWSAAQLAE